MPTTYELPKTNTLITPFEEYRGKESTFLTCVSYEDRPVLSLQEVLNRKNINKCILIKLTDLFSDRKKGSLSESDAIDFEVRNAWEKNYEKIVSLLEKWNVEKIEVSGSYFRPYYLAEEINSVLPTNEEILFDISALPKHILLSTLRWCEGKAFTFLYARPEHEREAEAEFSVGTKRIGVIRGYEGELRFDRLHFLVLILGFEGARALSIFRHFEPYRALALLGNPEPLFDNKISKFYLVNASKNNSQLLSNQRVIISNISSLDPYAFKNELNEKILKYTEETDSNILISCLGTKPQTLGLYLYWLEHKNVQIIYSIPSKRRIPSEGIKQIWIYKLSEIKT